MKVGLITVYHADYGSFFQAYALYDQLKKLGHDVELIHESHRFRKSVGNIISFVGYKFFPGPFKNLCRKKAAVFNTYCILKNDQKNIRFGRVTLSYKKRYQGYDCIVVGSDELWSATNPKIKYYKDYFGVGMDNSLISYGTSGIYLDEDKLPARVRDEIKSGLSRFSSLLVRDQKTLEWAERTTGKECSIVIDPTLLDPFFVQRSDEKPYIAVYGEDFDDEHIEKITAYSRETGMKLVALSWNHSWCDEFFEAESATDLQKAFADAKYCISSTFHGTVFSILAHREFTSFLTERRGTKIKQLLSDLQLNDRIYTDRIITEKIDFDAVENKLSDLRHKSLELLKQALEKVECERGIK